jgi:hypothetical protein
MTPFGIAILLCLLLAVGATVASCLIPQLTVAGIWGIPVLGFALLVGVIFRIAVYYEPRVSNPQKHAGWVAGGFLGYVLLWSSFDLIFVDRSAATIFGTVFGAFVLLSSLSIAEHIWVTYQTHGGVYPTFFELRRFIFFISSSVNVLGYLANSDAMINAVKSLVIFFTYANCVHFAAIYAGILHPVDVFASNGTIAERLKAWIRSKIQPGVLFSTVQTLLIAAFFAWLFIEAFCEIPARLSLISKGIFAAITAVSFYLATLYDPRKPPETSKLWLRILGGLVHFAIAAYYDWYVYSKDYQHFVTLITICLLRFGLLFGLMTQEMSKEVFQQKLTVIAFHLAMYTLSSVMFLLLNILSMSAIVQTVALTFCNVWYYYITIYVIAVISGKYRDVVRQADPMQAPAEILVV